MALSLLLLDELFYCHEILAIGWVSSAAEEERLKNTHLG